MAKGTLNKILIIGNLGADPEVRTTPSGLTVVNISVATTELVGSREERQERTEWHRIVLYGRVGELARDYLKKGRKVYVEGRIQTRRWTDKNGVERFTTEIIGSNILFLSSLGPNQDSGDVRIDSVDREQTSKNTSEKNYPDSTPLDDIDILDGELPF